MDANKIEELYGKPGTNQAYANLPYPMVLAWDKSTTIIRFQCHSKVKAKVEAIFKEVLAVYGIEKIKKLRLDVFGGCLNVRPMRGSTKPSVHSWGLAIDLDPENNTLKMSHLHAKFAKQEYIKFWEIVEKHGGISLGRQKDYDWMHFQFIPL